MRSPTAGNQGAQPWRSQRGSITAEFAAVVPAILLVLAAALVSVQVAGEQLRLQDATADAARSLARGDPTGVATARIRSAIPGARLSVVARGDMICAKASARSRAAGGLLSSLTVRATGCAMDGGL